MARRREAGEIRGTIVQSAANSAVDERLRTPLYHQIYLILRDGIANGRYGKDAMVPGEQELTTMFGVSRITAKRALDELAVAGLVVRERGRGTRVRAETPPPIHSSVEGLLENLMAMGLTTEVRLLQFSYVAAPRDVAAALGCAPGTTVQHAVRMRLLEGEPFSHLTTYVPEHIGRSYDREDLASTPLLALLERCGVVVSSAEQTITAVLADSRVALALNVEMGSPLLRLNRVVYDQDGGAVEHIIGLYRPDRYQYRMKLTRIQGEESKMWSPAV